MGWLAVTWSLFAVHDRDRLLLDLAEDAPAAAHSLDERIEQKVAIIQEHADLFPPGRRRGTREAVVSPAAVIIYSVLPAQGGVKILRILASAPPLPKK